eukprot:7595001-Pyramimonas_sp.AAC.1
MNLSRSLSNGIRSLLADLNHSQRNVIRLPWVCLTLGCLDPRAINRRTPSRRAPVVAVSLQLQLTEHWPT